MEGIEDEETRRRLQLRRRRLLPARRVSNAAPETLPVTSGTGIPATDEAEDRRRAACRR